jgi:hypothetical protein
MRYQDERGVWNATLVMQRDGNARVTVWSVGKRLVTVLTPTEGDLEILDGRDTRKFLRLGVGQVMFFRSR